MASAMLGLQYLQLARTHILSIAIRLMVCAFLALRALSHHTESVAIACETSCCLRIPLTVALIVFSLAACAFSRVHFGRLRSSSPFVCGHYWNGQRHE